MDVVVIGGGHAGLIVSKACIDAGLQVAVIDLSGVAPDGFAADWISGRGVVSDRGMVAVLDPETADERRVVPTKAIVLAVGQLEPENLPKRVLGITKLGVELTADGRSIICNSRGETRADGVFAIGSCASSPTPHIAEAIVSYCTKSLAER